MENLFIEIGLIVGVTIIVSSITRLLKQPLIIGYIFSGIILGPYLFGFIRSLDTLNIFSQLGIAFLLFIVGLSLNPGVIKEVGKVSLITGIGQVLFTSIIGFAICRLIGFSSIASIYIAIALTFSSTIIIMKLLSDKGDLETLYGRISVGFLIVQDFVAVFILMFISSFANGGEVADIVVSTILRGAFLCFLLFMVGHYFLPRILRAIAKSQEFLLLFSVGWCLIVASVFTYAGFSLEIGALLAGMTLSMSPFRYEIASHMRTLRDFFIILFFIILGSQIVFTTVSENIWLIMGLSTFILIGNPLIVILLMNRMRYSKKTAFFAGLTVAQISEFSIILIALGQKVGHLGPEILSIVTTVGLITITGSTYMILYSNNIFSFLSKYIVFFEKDSVCAKNKECLHDEGKEKIEILLFGCHRMGSELVGALKSTKKKFFVVDYDPQMIDIFSKEGIDFIYGDIEDLGFLDSLDLSATKMVVSTVLNFDANKLLLKNIKARNPKAAIILVASDIHHAVELYKAGATYVVTPHFLVGYHTASMIKKHGVSKKCFLREGARHKKYLKKKQKKFLGTN